jgi:F-type H+-transporting ATPase subunit b
MLIQLIIIQVVTFIVIIFVIRKMLYTETTKETERLKKLRDEFSKKEKELQVKIEAAQKDAEAKLAETEKNVRKYREAKEKEAQDLREAILAKARDRAEEMVKAAVNSKGKIKEELELEMKGRIPAAAVKLFKETLPAEAREGMHNELVQEVAARIRKLDKEMFKTRLEKGELLSAYPVKKSDKEAMLSAISEKTGHGISFTEKEDKEIVAGLIIKLGTLVIDGSLENKLRQIGEKLG